MHKRKEDSMIYFTVSNIHDYGKKNLTRSGDMNVVSDLIEAQGFDAPVIYAGISNYDVKRLASLYPNLHFIHFSKAQLKEDDILVTPMMYNDFENRVTSDEVNQYLKFLKQHKLALLNVCRWNSFYDDVINNAEGKTKDLLQEVIGNAIAYIAHHPSLRKHDAAKKAHFYASSYTQIVSCDIDTSQKQSKFTGRTLVFCRPGSTKGFDLWLKDTYRQEMHVGKDDLFFGNISGLSKLQQYIEDFETEFDVKFDEEVELFTDVDDYLNRRNNKDVRNKIKIINSSYSSGDLDQIIDDFEMYGISTNYLHMIDGDYPVIEYTMLEALNRGLSLYWYPSSINTMLYKDKQYAFEQANAISEAPFEDQLKYYSYHFNKQKLYDVVETGINLALKGDA